LAITNESVMLEVGGSSSGKTV